MSNNTTNSHRKKISRWRSFVFLGLLFAAIAGGAFYYIFFRQAPVPPPQLPEQAFVDPPPLQQAAPPPPLPLPVAPKEKEPVKAKLAIIIDDIGNGKTTAEKIMDLDMPLSFSILPHTPFSKSLAARANQLGKDVLLHLPMEPTDKKWNTGPGTLFTDMSAEVIQATLLDNIKPTPMIVGINNHMGSKFTESQESMTLFFHAMQTLPLALEQQRPAALFFIDSLTSSQSVGYQLAMEMGIKTAKRNVFLDNDRVPAKILHQLRLLVTIAKRNGWAIGIGHPHPETFEILHDAQDFLKQEVQLVPIHELVR